MNIQSTAMQSVRILRNITVGFLDIELKQYSMTPRLFLLDHTIFRRVYSPPDLFVKWSLSCSLSNVADNFTRAFFFAFYFKYFPSDLQQKHTERERRNEMENSWSSLLMGFVWGGKKCSFYNFLKHLRYHHDIIFRFSLRARIVLCILSNNLSDKMDLLG